MALLFKSHADNPDWWGAELTRRVPDLDFRIWPDVGDPSTIDMALVWQPQRGMLCGFPNLKVIFSLGAGVDHIFADLDLPANVPVTRLIDPHMTSQISEYAIHAVIRRHRRFDDYDNQKRRRKWCKLGHPDDNRRRVGILGLGEIGADIGRKLAALNFPVAGWSRAPKNIPGIQNFAGADQLHPMLTRSDFLICTLPLTPATQGIINTQTLGALPQGAYVINVARGGHVVDCDLLAALDSGHIAGAMLDVFGTEPLPDDHPYWRHAKISITPHVAGLTNAETGADQVAENIRRLRAGKPLINLVDLKAGY